MRRWTRSEWWWRISGDDDAWSAEVADFAESFAAATGRAVPNEAFAFGDTPTMADELAEVVLSGRKRATTGLVAEHDAEGTPLPRRGDTAVVIDGSGAPVCVIQTTAVSVGRLVTVTAAHARAEGEGDGTRESWLADHRAFFAPHCARLGIALDDDTMVVFEEFEVVWPR